MFGANGLPQSREGAGSSVRELFRIELPGKYLPNLLAFDATLQVLLFRVF
jgi:hypothetical protein